MSFEIVFLAASLALGPVPGGQEARATFESEHEQDAQERERERQEREQEKLEREQERKEREDEAYDEGTSALDEGAWGRAARNFRRVADAKNRRSDGALYWLAYARYKQGQAGEAAAALAELRKD